MKDTIQFLCESPLWKEEQPYELYGFPEVKSDRITNCTFETKEVEVQDARDPVHNISLATHGFIWVRHKSSCPLDAKHFEPVEGPKEVLAQYLKETIELVKSQIEAVDVICFDWRFRRRDPLATGRIPPRAIGDIRHFALPTGDVVHCDYSAAGGRDRLHVQLLPWELEQLQSKGRRAMIVNAWRPLNDVVKNTPLLMCDRTSVLKTDLIEVDKVLSDKVEKSYFLFHRPYHRWFSLSEQRSDEVCIFPTWLSHESDDETTDVADCSPHGAGGSETDGWADPRQSIEVRLIVI